MIHEKLRNELINKALEPFNITIERILKDYPDGIIPTGVVKNKKPIEDYYWNVYYWNSLEEYETWRKWALERIKDTKYTKYDLDWMEATFDLKHSYIFKKEGELF